MFYIVESRENLERLKSLRKYGCFFNIIKNNDRVHPKLANIVGIYIRPLVTDDDLEKEGLDLSYNKGYILPVDHNEGLSVRIEDVAELLYSFSELYTLDKKDALYFFPLGSNTYDVSLLYSMTFYKKLEISSFVSPIQTRVVDSLDCNRIIPLSKLYEKSEKIFEEVREYIGLEKPQGFQFYNELGTKLYFLIEQEGLRVDVHEFVERFKPYSSKFSIEGETVYGSYNMYNTTSRPTNSFNSVNFLAIPKGKEFRRLFKPKNGKFVEMDFDGYHIRLISKLVGYPLSTEEKAHKQLAKLYSADLGLSEESDYGKIKGLNFQMVYGTPSEECSSLEISEKVQTFIKTLWKQYKKEKKISNSESKKEFTTRIPDMYPQKLFNYLVQSLETSRNIRVLYKVLRLLQQYKSKVVLVTYDSFLIDWDQTEDILEDIQKILEEEGYPVGIKISDDLCF